MKKSPVGSWRSFFNLGKSSSVSKRKLQRNPSEPSEMKAIALAGEAPFRNPGISAVQSDVCSGLLSPSSVRAVHDTSSSCSFPIDLGQFWSLLGLAPPCFAWSSFGKTRCGCCCNKSQDNSFWHSHYEMRIQFWFPLLLSEDATRERHLPKTFPPKAVPEYPEKAANNPL